MTDKGDRAKGLEIPMSHYSTLPFDKVLLGNIPVGVSTYSGYNSNERAWLSLAIVDEEQSRVGTELKLVWGEENGGSSKPTVERHRQIEIGVTVGPCPYSDFARISYRKPKL
jgi:hypothetical protein